MTQSLLEPFYFGPHQQLFGVYHPPARAVERAVGVVLCYPMGQEYLRAHRAFVHLAMRLAQCGFHTLRFDFSGCGDSSEEGNAAVDLKRWEDDIAIAVEELRGGSTVEAVCLGGLRLGGSLAAVVSASRGDVDALVLWDPVVSGAEYLAEIRGHHQEWLRGSFAKGRTHGKNVDDAEVLGFALAEPLVRSLELLDLLELSSLPAPRVSLLDTRGNRALGSVLDRLRWLGASVEIQRLNEPPVWVKQRDDLGNVAVPVRTLEAVVEQLTRWYL